MRFESEFARLTCKVTRLPTPARSSSSVRSGSLWTGLPSTGGEKCGAGLWGPAKCDAGILTCGAKGQVLLVNLAKGGIGEDSSALLGGLLVTAIGLAAHSRADTPTAVHHINPDALNARIGKFFDPRLEGAFDHRKSGIRVCYAMLPCLTHGTSTTLPILPRPSMRR